MLLIPWYLQLFFFYFSTGLFCFLANIMPRLHELISFVFAVTRDALSPSLSYNTRHASNYSYFSSYLSFVYFRLTITFICCWLLKWKAILTFFRTRHFRDEFYNRLIISLNTFFIFVVFSPFFFHSLLFNTFDSTSCLSDQCYWQYKLTCKNKMLKSFPRELNVLILQIEIIMCISCLVASW